MSEPHDPTHAPSAPEPGGRTPRSGPSRKPERRSDSGPGPASNPGSSPGQSQERRRRRRGGGGGGPRPEGASSQSPQRRGPPSSPGLPEGGARPAGGGRPECAPKGRRPDGGGGNRRSGDRPRREGGEQGRREGGEQGRREGGEQGRREQGPGPRPGAAEGRPRRDRPPGSPSDERPRRDRPSQQGSDERPRRDRPPLAGDERPPRRDRPPTEGEAEGEGRRRRPPGEERSGRRSGEHPPVAPASQQSPVAPGVDAAPAAAEWSRSAVPPWEEEDADAPPPPRLVRVAPAEPPPPEVPVQFYDLCGVKVRQGGPAREFECRSERYAVGDWVLVDGERGQRVGQVVVATRRRHALSPPRRVIRRARPDEVAERERALSAESEAHRFCKERLRERKLSMKLVQTEVVPGQKTTFYFASEDRVDFRDLVRDLAQHLHTRIEMRQIGARDGAKAVGGIGSCGRELCCTTFLPAFQPISIRMAKDQGMVLNPTKLAGQCGRLKCCLVYEHHTYKEMGKGLPKVGKRVQTPVGLGRVLDLDILRQRVRVLLEEGGAETFAASELRPLGAPGGGSGGGGGPAPGATAAEAESDAPEKDSPEVPGLSDD